MPYFKVTVDVLIKAADKEAATDALNSLNDPRVGVIAWEYHGDSEVEPHDGSGFEICDEDIEMTLQ